MRALKWHEQKLLKKVDFLNWKSDTNLRDNGILKKFRIDDREDLIKYSKLCKNIRELVDVLRKLKPEDEFRIECSKILLQKLYAMGVINDTNSLESCERLGASSFCRRRFAVVVWNMKFCESLKQACTYVSHGHLAIGPDVCLNPATHISRNMEDYICWSRGSNIKRHIGQHNESLDDFEMLGN
eukprot:GHVL01024123.1.p1 GENE.GHVL01024123.1~~GHVL01024123.1.p1  ORF type:complete len:184 (+),score=19.93 GHVL01024123.1:33-584(+)